jgi:transmembrane sensor
MTREVQGAEEAASWVNRLDQPAIDTSASATFDGWMAAEPSHRGDFADIQALWHSDVLTEALERAVEPPARARVHRFPRLRRSAPWMAVAASVASLTALLLLPGLSVTSYRTGTGNGEAIILADGSHVRLSGDAELHVRILPWGRAATLARGEAFFDVRHESWRQFVVQSGATSVRVLGTAFNVDRQSPTRTAVEVYRGVVALETESAEDLVLRRGGRARVVDDRIFPQLSNAVPTTRTAPDWTSGWFEAADVPMNVLIAKVQRYSARPIRLRDPAVAALPVSGRFRVSEPARVLQAIRTAYDLEVRYGAKAIVIGPSRKAASAP